MPITAIVVEHHDDIRLMIRTLLESPTVDVDVVAEAADAEEGWRAVRRHRPDLLVIDVAVGGARGGLELARRVRRSNPAQTVILVGSFLNESVRAAAIDTGAAGVVDLGREVGLGDLVRSLLPGGVLDLTEADALSRLDAEVEARRRETQN